MAKPPPAPQNLREVIFRVCVFCPPSRHRSDRRPAAYGQGSCQCGWRGDRSFLDRTTDPNCFPGFAPRFYSPHRCPPRSGAEHRHHATEVSRGDITFTQQPVPFSRAARLDRENRTAAEDLTQHHFNSEGREGTQSSLWSCAAGTACAVSPPSGLCPSCSLPTSWQRGQCSEKVPQQLQD